MTRHGPTTNRRHAWLYLACLLLLALPAGAWGDAVKLGGFWIEVEQVRGIEDGQIIYLTPNGTEVRRPLSNLEGVRVDDYPELEKGLAQASAGEYEKAIDLFQTVAHDAQADWLKTYAKSQWVRAQTSAGHWSAAANGYLDLIEAGAEDDFLQPPPTAGLNKLSESEKTTLERRIRRALGQTQPASVIEQLTKIRRVIQAKAKDVHDESPPLPGTSGESSQPSQPSQQSQQNPASSPVQATVAGITLPDRLKATSAVRLLDQGRLNQALAQAEEATHTPGGLGENLFILGLCQLALAEQSENPADYKDAGLSFMRVVVYFENSPYAPLALLETGYVHQRIGRADIAQQLYPQARRAIEHEGAEKAYPNYYPRMLKLIGQR